MVFWLRFRVLQTFRMLQSAGWGILVALLVVTAALWVQVIDYWAQIRPEYALGITFFLTGILHLWRTDRLFLQRGNAPVWHYCLVDYGGVALLFAVFPLLQWHWAAAAGSFAGLVWAAFPPGLLAHKQSRKMVWTPGFIPVSAYEWRMNIRSQWPAWIVAILLVGCTFFHEVFYLAGMFVGLITFPQAFDFLEPYSMRPENKTALLRRWRVNARVMYYWLIPGAAVLLLKNYHWAPAIIYVVLVYELFLLLCTCYKYNAWAPGRRRTYNGTALGVATLMAAIPGGIIALAGMTGWYYYRISAGTSIPNAGSVSSVMRSNK